MITDQQQVTLDWMRRTRPAAVPAPAATLVYLEGGFDGDAAVIHPNGSYRTVRLGEVHPPPYQRRAAV